MNQYYMFEVAIFSVMGIAPMARIAFNMLILKKKMSTKDIAISLFVSMILFINAFRNYELMVQ